MVVEPHLRTLTGEVIPLRTIYCIGRNYTAHAREMNVEPPTEPVVFIKPDRKSVV